MEPLLTVLAIGFIGGSLSGLLGIGGGILTAPLLLYVPALLGQPPLSMHSVSGLTISQSLLAGLLGGLLHGRRGAVDVRLARTLSIAIFIAALVGGIGSKYCSHDLLLAVFVVLGLTAAVLIFQPERAELAADGSGPRHFSAPLAVASAGSIGFLGGLVGQGGSFLLIPAMVFVLRTPLRIAMGTNLVVVFFASLAGFLAKALTGQVPGVLTLALLVGVAPGTWAGARLSPLVPTRTLRRALGVLVLLACARMTWEIVN